MINIPTETLSQYSSILVKKSIPVSYHYDYKKWLRYYLDFCHKYGFNHSNRESLAQFIKKLQEKHQPQPQQKQAASAVSFYYESLQPNVNQVDGKDTVLGAETHPRSEQREKIIPSSHVQVSQIEVQEKSQIPEGSVVEQWKKTYADMFGEIKIRHYSPKTLKSYTIWVRKFQGFTKNKSPLLLSSADVKEFLKYLAIRQNVSASTQNPSWSTLV